jgi:putative pyoverdin transport system ATP-binding/permease protein
MPQPDLALPEKRMRPLAIYIKLARFFLQTSWKLIALSSLFSVISGASNVWLVAQINTALGNSWGNKLGLIGKFSGLCLLVIFSGIISQLVLVRLAQGVVYELRLCICRKILASPLRRLEEVGAHKIITVIGVDVSTLANTIIIIPTLCMNLALVVGCLAYIIWLHWLMLPLICGFIALSLVGRLGFIRVLKRLHELMRKQQDEMFKHFNTIINAAKELRLNCPRRSAFLDSLQSTSGSFMKYSIDTQKIESFASRWHQFLVFVLIGLILFGFSAPNNDQKILTSCLLTFLYVMGPIMALIGATSSLLQANIAISHVESVGLSFEDVLVDAGLPLYSEPTSSWKSIELRGVTHAYTNEQDGNVFRVGPLNLAFIPGELVFLIGGNGSGKTTLAKLFTGLYAPESGAVQLNGVTVTDETRDNYRQLFSAVFTDFYVFENLFGLEKPSLNGQSYDLLKRLQLDHKVEIKDGLLSTVDLSQGQRKRLALLNAYLEDRSVYVFDEWAADQDPNFKNIFYTTLLPELKAKGKTVLAINHDEKYFHIADRIIKLDSGQLEYDRPMNK